MIPPSYTGSLLVPNSIGQPFTQPKQAVVDIVMPCYGSPASFDGMFNFAEMRAKLSASYRVKNVLWRNWNWADNVRNELTAVALNDPEVTHVLYMEHDHLAFPPDSIERLLAHNLPVVGALYFQRTPPCEAAAGLMHPDGHHISFLRRLPDGLLKVDWCGLGFLLVKREVLLDVSNSYRDNLWFRYQGDGGRPDDMWFFDRLRSCRIQVHVDGGLRIGHVAHHCITDKTWEAYHRQT